MNTMTEGMPGEPIPYMLRSDGMVTSIMFLCILLVSFSFSKYKKHLLYEAKNFIYSRERNRLFDEINATDARHTLLLLFHTSVMFSFCAYYYLSTSTPLIFENISHALLLGTLVLSSVVFILIKWITYQGINWVFFQKERNSLWIKTFVNLLIWMGILLLPVVLLVTYFEISPEASLYIIGSLLLFSKIVLFWKCFCNFFEKIHGAFHLILYFCALEILPDLLLWKGMEIISNNLI